mgnify:CR=1 FL=1
MGQSKGSGYEKMQTLTPQQQQLQNQLLGQIGGNYQNAAAGFNQFLPGGGGGKAISDAAHQRFQQETIPSIMNAFGTGSKTSSALNQALASGASNLNTDIASQLAQMQLQAASGLGNLAQGQQGPAFQSAFDYKQKQTPFWQQAILGGLGLAGQAGSAYLGAPRTNLNFGG